MRRCLAGGLALALSACAAAAPLRDAPPEAVYAKARPLSAAPEARLFRLWGDDLDPAHRAAATEALRRSTMQRWREHGAPAAGIDFDVLALSGGGPDGAFAAGLLSGWSTAGTRPEFEIVTGISVGALIAPFVFLGPDYDPVLRTIFTELGTDSVAELQIFSALFGALGVADSNPLRETLRRMVDEPLLEAIAAESRRGRVLLVGTTNIDAQRPVIWNMGAIAEAGEIDLFREVMLASASIPGAFPPAQIRVESDGAVYTEFHVDGGVTHSVIIGPSGVRNLFPRDLPFPIRRTFYVIQNNSLVPAYKPVEPWLPAIAARSLSTLIRGQSDGDLLRIALAAQEAEADFRLVFVPPEFAAPSTTDFDTEYMAALFEAAYRDALDGIDWMDTPPSLIGRDAIERELAAR
jgi:predicted acylesterase/phospholipase RssA